MALLGNHNYWTCNKTCIVHTLYILHILDITLRCLQVSIFHITISDTYITILQLYKYHDVVWRPCNIPAYTISWRLQNIGNQFEFFMETLTLAVCSLWNTGPCKSFTAIVYIQDFGPILHINGLLFMLCFYEIALSWMPTGLTDDKSTLG